MSELLDSSGNNDDGDVTAAGNVPERSVLLAVYVDTTTVRYDEMYNVP